MIISCKEEDLVLNQLKNEMDLVSNNRTIEGKRERISKIIRKMYLDGYNIDYIRDKTNYPKEKILEIISKGAYEKEINKKEIDNAIISIYNEIKIISNRYALSEKEILKKMDSLIDGNSST